ncbi:MAG: tetraacyldisaccharide 4'-kinase [Planctomycetota bacterium]
MSQRATAPIPGPLGRIASVGYALGLDRRSRRFDRGKGVVTLDRPVISVGNLSVGGTGKTPMVARIVRTLRDAGKDPAIAMRGYKSRDGISDEAELYRSLFDDLPIVAQPDRLFGLIKMFGSERGQRVDCIVLDDGFQHRRIARQMDIVLIDATKSPFNDCLLPAGWLRERPTALARATHVVITHVEASDSATVTGIRCDLASIAPTMPIATCRHAWSSLDVSDNGVDRTEPVAWLRNKRVLAVCAIGSPQPFLDGVAAACGSPAMCRSVVLPDHDAYEPRAVARVLVEADGVDVIVTTGKDWTKLARRDVAWPLPIARPRLELEFADGEAAFDEAVLMTSERTPD